MSAVLDWKKGVELFFTETVQRRAVFLVQLLLLLLLAAALARLTWSLLADDGTQAAVPPAQQAAAVAPAREAGRSWNIARWHLFGTKPTQAVQQATPESLPETRLNLTLRGVVAAVGGEGGGAIIAAPNRDESFYAVAAQLPGGAVLKEVYPDRVVLERGGRLETLRLPRERLDNAAPAPLPVQQGAAEAAAVMAPQPELTLNQYRELALSNPQQLTDAVRIAPRNDGGRFVGYEVQPGRDPGLLNRLGLVPGDVVTSVNGIGVDSPARALGILRSLNTSDEIRIEVQREGVAQTLFVNVRE